MKRYNFPHRCPTTDELDLAFFNFHSLSWGFQFTVPKFQGYEDLYISCDTYVCDSILDVKPYCDRSCLTRGGPPARERRNPLQVQALVTENAAALMQGPFTVKGTGFGPLISGSGKVHVIGPNGAC